MDGRVVCGWQSFCWHARKAPARRRATDVLTLFPSLTSWMRSSAFIRLNAPNLSSHFQSISKINIREKEKLKIRADSDTQDQLDLGFRLQNKSNTRDVFQKRELYKFFSRKTLSCSYECHPETLLLFSSL
ncbi:hypothetical protein O6H91_08G034200 [Diphasiastrum complanatum]|uniref:Uncharacterized protein n=1 Tax=Diphasiastrum complanatum TaxID=34168 RepID=A0ACC2CW93_DIPCM|nr:hypothetical protein O6H91_08G034200 [Diphasiastrum complanatum]